MATNYTTNPFAMLAHPFSGSLSTNSTVDLIQFVNPNPFHTSSKQAELGSISLNYTAIKVSTGSDGGVAGDIVFKVAGNEYLNKSATEVFRLSATGSSNTPRIGIGDFSKSGTIDAILHVKGDTIVEDGRLKFTKSNESDVEITKDDIRDLIEGTAVADTTKNALRGGLSQTFRANGLVNLADTSTLVKANESGKLELKANNLTLVGVDATDSDEPIVDLGNKPAGKVLVTGSLNVTGSNVTFDVDDLLTLLGNFGQTGSFAVSGSSEFTGDVNMDGAVTVTDLLTVVAGFGVTGSTDISGSTTISGSLRVSDDITASSRVFLPAGTSTAPSLASAGDPDTGIYFPAPNNIAVQASGGLSELTVHPSSISLTTQTGGSDTVTVTTDLFKVSSSLSVSSSQVDFTNLPTSDPGVAGRLYQTASAAVGMTAGYQVVLISA